MRECCQCTILNKTDCIFGATRSQNIKVVRNNENNLTGLTALDSITIFKCPIDGLPSKAITNIIAEYLDPPFYPALQAAYDAVEEK